MANSSPSERPGAFLSRGELDSTQLRQIQELLGAIRRSNRFYGRKLEAAGVPENIPTLELFRQRVPFTLKTELADDQLAHPPYGTNLTFPLEDYCRYHQTSGTSGQPLRWLDTLESWEWMVGNWVEIFRAAGVNRGDRVLFAFSFGPFIGFWLAFEAGGRLGALCFPGGGMSSAARARAILENQITVLCCTPTYGIHLAETALPEAVPPDTVRLLIAAGEPGASIPATRARLQALWPGARIFDHHGMTEVGPVSHECPEQPGRLHVLERSYLAEIIEPNSGRPVPPGSSGELILTPLGRTGSPLLRYRTGDLVKAVARPPGEPCRCGRYDLALDGGILGRIDDMVTVRGVNVFPTAIEGIVRKFPEVVEFQARISRQRVLPELRIRIELAPGCANPAAVSSRLEKEFETALSLRVPVSIAAALPRSEMKSKRWIIES